MPQTPDEQQAADGEPTVPVEEWIPHPVSDSAEYLDGAGPSYGDKLTGAEADEFTAAVAEREKKLSGHAPRGKRKK